MTGSSFGRFPPATNDRILPISPICADAWVVLHRSRNRVVLSWGGSPRSQTRIRLCGRVGYCLCQNEAPRACSPFRLFPSAAGTSTTAWTGRWGAKLNYLTPPCIKSMQRYRGRSLYSYKNSRLAALALSSLSRTWHRRHSFFANLDPFLTRNLKVLRA